MVKSCGCLGIEARGDRLRTHGRSKTKSYWLYRAIITRCYNPKSAAYKNYGGRGIVMCDEWKASFEAFYAAMGERPEGLSIDRKNNDGPYSKDNCRWATPLQQANNKRRKAPLG